MTESELHQLYPPDTGKCRLRGLYLAEKIGSQTANGKPYIYTNFVSSLDGRIALIEKSGEWQVPSHLTTPADWLMFKELQAHADCLITHSGYLRALSSGDHGNILQIPSTANNRYLSEWRRHQHLASQPKLVVVSRTLNFSLPKEICVVNQPVTIITGSDADKTRIKEFEKSGVDVHNTQQPGLVTADQLYQVLQRIGAQNVYLQTGPEMLHSMLTSKLLDRLYLTLNLTLLGGDPILTMVSGNTLLDRASMHLKHLYLLNSPDRGDINNAGYCDEKNTAEQQLFACFDVNKTRHP